jgi:hypothetical protein
MRDTTLLTTDETWLARIINEAGCVDIKHRPGQKPALRLRVKNHNEGLIEAVAQTMDRAYYRCPGKGRKPQFEATITGRHAEELVDRLMPVLDRSRQQEIAEVRQNVVPRSITTRTDGRQRHSASPSKATATSPVGDRVLWWLERRVSAVHANLVATIHRRQLRRLRRE